MNCVIEVLILAFKMLQGFAYMPTFACTPQPYDAATNIALIWSPALRYKMTAIISSSERSRGKNTMDISGCAYSS